MLVKNINQVLDVGSDLDTILKSFFSLALTICLITVSESGVLTLNVSPFLELVRVSLRRRRYNNFFNIIFI